LKVQVVIGGEVYEVEVEDSEDEASQSPTEASTRAVQSVVLPTVPLPGSVVEEIVDDPKIYRSPIAGLVAQVHVVTGQEVKVGDVMIVLEAMKMETRIAATTAGKLKAVSVALGAAVQANQILLEFE
jgi:biotin carboxyl carrier protein